MEIIVPHQIIYELERPASVSDIVAALLGVEQLLRESGPILESCISGLTIERVQISVRRLSQDSPLRIAFFAALVAVYQKDLDRAIPMIAEKLLGTHVPQEYNTVLTLTFCLLLFYGAESIYAQVNKKTFSKRLRGEFDGVAKELSGECNITEERIKNILEKRYGKSRLRVLAQSALSLFKPSKQQNNAPIVIGERRIDTETVREIPSDAEIERADVPELARPFSDILIELHAQDVDRARVGWAGVIPEISPRRLRIELEPPIQPNEIYTKQKIRADIMLISRKKPDGTYQAHAIHLLDVKKDV